MRGPLDAAAPTPQDGGVRRALAALVLGSLGCTPPLDPPWLLGTPTELALHVEVVAQGPYGAPIEPSPRTPRDALPRDTISLTPIIVDADGPIDLDALEGMWTLCSGIGNCLFRGDRVAERAECTGDEIQPAEPCVFGRSARATLPLADFPDPSSAQALTVFDLLTGPTVTFVASAPDGPGLDACLERLERRTSLEGCLMMERVLGLGPLGELVDLLIALGIDPGIGPEADTLLARPRNRNPAVEEFLVRTGTESQRVAAGSRITVPAGVAVEVSVLTTEEDLDSYEVDVEGQTVIFSDPLSAQWWLDAEVERSEDDLPGELRLRFEWEAQTEVRAYVVLRDGYGGEGWGWLELARAG